MSDKSNQEKHNLSPDTLRAVIWNQLLWTAGYALTTGGFLVYFAKDLGANPLQISLILVIPETFGSLGLFSRRVINLFQSRKKTWLVLSLISRVASLGIPLAALVEFDKSIDSLYAFFIPALVLVSVLNSLAYMAYLSWLTDLAPETQWGEFFAKRNIAKLCILLVVPVIAGFTRDWLRKEVNPATAHWIYISIYALGVLLLLISLIPMLSLADIMRGEIAKPAKRNYKGHLKQVLQNRSLSFLLIHNWWLAFFNGLTQAVFFTFLFAQLNIQLGVYYLLVSTMQLVKIPTSHLAGQWCDENREKRVMIYSLFVASSGLLFWIISTRETWFILFGAYAFWGAYAALNLSGRNLLLKLSPRSDNSFELSLFRQVGGFFAGLSGLLGGFWLLKLNDPGFNYQIGAINIDRFQLIFLVSLIGRYLSVLWLIPVKQPVSQDQL